MKLLLALATLIFISTSNLLAEEKCIYPSPDGAGLNHSEPSITGEIEEASENQITIKGIKIQINNQTAISTFYGGHTTAKHFAEGQESEVWYIGCKMPQGNVKPMAAVVRIESKKSSLTK